MASFFVSRVDTEVDRRLDKLGSDEAKALRGKAAVANARLAYELRRAAVLPGLGALGRADDGRRARTQRPLWASTGMKDPAYPDTLYVVELVAPDTVNTMPEADHGADRRPRRAARQHRERAATTTPGQLFAALEGLGIGYDDVVRVLEDEGVDKFAVSWNEMLNTIRTKMGL